MEQKVEFTATELGRALGGYVNVVTKSGTNNVRGDLYERSGGVTKLLSTGPEGGNAQTICHLLVPSRSSPAWPSLLPSARCRAGPPWVEAPGGPAASG